MGKFKLTYFVNCTSLNVSVLHSVFFSVARLMFLLIYSKLDRVIPFLRGFGSPWREWIRLGICPWNWWSADETHRRRNWGLRRLSPAQRSAAEFRGEQLHGLTRFQRRRWSALLLSGFPPLPPFAARTHFPLSIYADIAGNLRGEVRRRRGWRRRCTRPAFGGGTCVNPSRWLTQFPPWPSLFFATMAS